MHMVAPVAGFFLLMNKHLFSWRSKRAAVHLANTVVGATIATPRCSHERREAQRDMRDERRSRISLRSSGLHDYAAALPRPFSNAG